MDARNGALGGSEGAIISKNPYKFGILQGAFYPGSHTPTHLAAARTWMTLPAACATLGAVCHAVQRPPTPPVAIQAVSLLGAKGRERAQGAQSFTVVHSVVVEGRV